MRISDWSSDVCSSDLEHGIAHDHRRFGRVQNDDRLAARGAADLFDRIGRGARELIDIGARARTRRTRRNGRDDLGIKIGRASCRERVRQYVWISVVSRAYKHKKIYDTQSELPT